MSNKCRTEQHAQPLRDCHLPPPTKSTAQNSPLFRQKMTPPIVLIIGCGVAGPVLANFYKRKGYHPIVFEKVRELGDAGASLMLMSNG